MNISVSRFIHTVKERGTKGLAVLVDPDKAGTGHLNRLLSAANIPHIDMVLVGGSVITSGDMASTIRSVKERIDVPCVIFPGSPDQIHPDADAILLLSLISGRNPDLLIGKHVEAAPALQRSGLEIIPTAYILLDGGIGTTVSYISNTVPIPVNKPELAAVTALAGQQLGMKVTYMDAGSGAVHPVSEEAIKQVRKWTQNPIIVGGGIKDAKGVMKAWNAGADIVVVGNALEKNPDLLSGLSRDRHSISS